MEYQFLDTDGTTLVIISITPDQAYFQYNGSTQKTQKLDQNSNISKYNRLLNGIILYLYNILSL